MSESPIYVDEIPEIFRSYKCELVRIPESTIEKIIFMYDYEQKFYVFANHEIDEVLLEMLLNNVSASFVIVMKVLFKIKEASTKTTKNNFEYSNSSYKKSIKALWFVVLMFLVFFVLVICRTYYQSSVNLEIIAIPFCSLGFIVNAGVIIYNSKFHVKENKSHKTLKLPDSYFRHLIFTILTKSNRNILIYGLEWKMMKEGRWIELTIKKPTIRLRSPKVSLKFKPNDEKSLS